MKKAAPTKTPGAPGSRPDNPIVLVDPVGLAEIGERIEVAIGTSKKWRHRGLLPEPDAIVSSTPLWNWATIEDWARATGRL